MWRSRIDSMCACNRPTPDLVQHMPHLYQLLCLHVICTHTPHELHYTVSVSVHCRYRVEILRVSWLNHLTHLLLSHTGQHCVHKQVWWNWLWLALPPVNPSDTGLPQLLSFSHNAGVTLTLLRALGVLQKIKDNLYLILVVFIPLYHNLDYYCSLR